MVWAHRVMSFNIVSPPTSFSSSQIRNWIQNKVSINKKKVWLGIKRMQRSKTWDCVTDKDKNFKDQSQNRVRQPLEPLKKRSHKSQDRPLKSSHKLWKRSHKISRDSPFKSSKKSCRKTKNLMRQPLVTSARVSSSPSASSPKERSLKSLVAFILLLFFFSVFSTSWHSKTWKKWMDHKIEVKYLDKN